ncbi:E3 ubiquitin-protein ligase MIEL1 [Balamuthia mandrillaris]
MDPALHLPPEILLQVVSHLDAEDAIALSMTNTTWQELLEDCRLWQSFLRRDVGVCVLLEQAPFLRLENEYRHLSSAERDQQALLMRERLEKTRGCSPPTTKAFHMKEHYFGLRSKREDLLPSYHQPKEEGLLGCPHYIRNAKMYAACCGRFYVCRHCHNESVRAKRHTIDRYSVQVVLCMVCNYVQPVGKYCNSPVCNGRALGEYVSIFISRHLVLSLSLSLSPSPSLSLALLSCDLSSLWWIAQRYYCDICKFWETNDKKEKYHCAPCNVCKLASHPSLIHCTTCHGDIARLATSHSCTPSRPSFVDSARPTCFLTRPFGSACPPTPPSSGSSEVKEEDREEDEDGALLWQ